MANDDIKKHLKLFESFAGDVHRDTALEADIPEIKPAEDTLDEEFKDPRVAALVKAVRLKGCLPSGEGCLGDKEIETMYRNEVLKAQRLGKRQPEEHARQVVLSMARPSKSVQFTSESAILEELTKAFEDYVGDKYDADKLYPKKQQTKPGKDIPKPKQPKKAPAPNELFDSKNARINELRSRLKEAEATLALLKNKRKVTETDIVPVANAPQQQQQPMQQNKPADSASPPPNGAPAQPAQNGQQPAQQQGQQPLQQLQQQPGMQQPQNQSVNDAMQNLIQAAKDKPAELDKALTQIGNLK